MANTFPRTAHFALRYIASAAKAGSGPALVRAMAKIAKWGTPGRWQTQRQEPKPQWKETHKMKLDWIIFAIAMLSLFIAGAMTYRALDDLDTKYAMEERV